MPSRSAAASLVPSALDELFAAGCDPRSDNALSLSYELLPWKRAVVIVRYSPHSLSIRARPVRPSRQ